MIWGFTHKRSICFLLAPVQQNGNFMFLPSCLHSLFYIYFLFLKKYYSKVFYICTNHAAVYIYTFVMGDRFTTIYIYTHCMLVCEKLVRIYGRWLLNHFEYVNHLLAWWFKCVNYHVQYRQQALTIQYCYTVGINL